MNSFVTKLKRFIGNKNTVTILCVVAGLAVLIVGYNWRVSEAINPTLVPYAKVTLESRHIITDDDIGYMNVNSDVMRKADNVIRNRNDLIGKEVTYGNSIPAGSLFYTEDITRKELSPDYVLSDIQDGFTAFSLSVDENAIYGNYVKIGSYIDLYFEGKDDYNQIIYTNFVKSIQVLDVRDSKGVSLNNSTNAPAELLFAVPDSLYSLLVKADEIGNLVPVPRNASYTANPGETEVTSSYVESFIESHSAVIPDENYTSSNNNQNNNEDE